MMAHSARQRYADIFRDVEKLVDDHSKLAAQLPIQSLSLIRGSHSSEN